MSVKSHLNASGVSSKPKNRKQSHVDWHEAATCAFQIELRDYPDILEYITEYVLVKNYHRIDLLIIKKLSDVIIPKTIALIFRTFNLMEIKGLGSSVSTDTYYKMIGYAGLFIEQTGESNQYSALDVSLTFLSLHYPQMLIKHLRADRKLTVANVSPGVYYINKETFTTQIIVTKELPPQENLYLRCLTEKIWNGTLAERLTEDYKEHQDEDIYRRYLHQMMTANIRGKGDEPMYICEGLLNFFGTSSEEIIERTKKEEAEYYQPKIDQLSSQNDSLSAQNDNLSAQVDYLKSLLRQHGIPFNLESEPSEC